MHDPYAQLLALTLAMMRPLGLLIVLPVLSQNVIGGVFVRNCIAMVIAIPILPSLGTALPHVTAAGATVFPMPGGMLLLSTCVREILIGALLGVFAAVPFWAIDSAGFLIDLMGGAELGAVYNPSLGEQSSQTGLLLSRALTVLFFTSGGFELLLKTLYESYTSAPILGEFKLSAAFPALLGQGLSAVYSLAARFAMPAIIIMFLVDFGFGLVNRAVEEMDVFFLAMPVKSVLGAFILALSASFGYELFLDWLSRIDVIAAHLFEALR